MIPMFAYCAVSINLELNSLLLINKYFNCLITGIMLTELPFILLYMLSNMLYLNLRGRLDQAAMFLPFNLHGFFFT